MKKRYPKGFDVAKPNATPKPDPERWVPKRLRKKYLAKHANVVAKGAQGAQGGGAVEKQVLYSIVNTFFVVAWRVYGSFISYCV